MRIVVRLAQSLTEWGDSSWQAEARCI